MGRNITLFILVLFFSSFRAVAQEQQRKRTITVCVLNDMKTRFLSGSETIELRPIPKETVMKIVSDASIEYDANTGITFEVVEYHEIKVVTKPTPVLQAPELRQACPLGEMVSVFTNQQMTIWSDPIPAPGFKKPVSFPRVHDGWSDVDYGIAWIFKTEFFDPASVGSSPTQTFKHEVGHLFGLDHSSEPTDFMYEKGVSDDWSDRIREGIKKNIDVHWKMKP